MPLRNPFARRHAAEDENPRPGSAAGHIDAAHPGFERVDTVGSKASPVLSIRSGRSQDTGVYKMSVVNDSGVYLPPSPVEKEAIWPKRYMSRASSASGGNNDDIEQFSISRESFDSYRRSFDIGAKSPIVTVDSAPRGSLDSSRFPRLPRSSLGERRFGQEPPTPEESFDESFEDVGLSDDNKQSTEAVQPTKKHSFFSKFGTDTATDAPMIHSQTLSRFLPSRKRAQGGQEAELGSMMTPMVDSPVTTNVLQEQEVHS